MKAQDAMEEIYMSKVLFVCQYLIRTESVGLLLALSDDLDSSTTALLVFGMMWLVLESAISSEEKLFADLRRVTVDETFISPA